MIRALFISLLLSLSAQQLCADILVPVRTIRPGQVIELDNLNIKGQDIPHAITRHDDIVGLEAKSVLYTGRPIYPQDVGPAALVERNQLVTLVFQSSGLNIATEGRALERGALGDYVKVLNLASRKTVWGRIQASGVVRVDG